jgi:hypothetical protein
MNLNPLNLNQHHFKSIIVETFLYVIMGLVVICNLGIAIWVVIKNNQSDEAYEKALDEIYGRK